MTSDPTDTGSSDPLFESTHPIFANKDLLKIRHVPDADRIVGRDEEIQKIAKHLNDAVQGSSPEDVVVYGKSGTGKSLVSKHVTQRAMNAADSTVNIGSAYIDCAEDSTEAQVVSSLAKTLNDEEETGISVPYTGLSTAKFYKLLWEVIDERFDSTIIILDEIDMVKDEGLLMKLSRAEESGKIESNVGTIAITNKIQYVEGLDERTRSSFRARDLMFEPYDANQLREIMYNREEAFHDDVLTDDVIPLSAAFAAQEHGDARKAIDTLRYAGEVAHQNDAEVVKEEHVRQAQQEAEKERFRELIGSAPTQAKIALFALSNLTTEHDEDSFITSRVYDEYEDICRELDVDSLSGRRFRDTLKEQAFLGIVEIQKKNLGPDGGIHNDNRLVENPEVVRETLLEDSRFHKLVMG